MSKQIRFKAMLEPLEAALEQLPEHRRGPNRRYTLRDGGRCGVLHFCFVGSSVVLLGCDLSKHSHKDHRRHKKKAPLLARGAKYPGRLPEIPVRPPEMRLNRGFSHRKNQERFASNRFDSGLSRLGIDVVLVM